MHAYGWDIYKTYAFESQIAARCYDRGILVDRKRIAKHRANITARMQGPLEAAREQGAQDSGDPKFNPQSPPQLGRLLYQVYNVTPPHYSKETGKPSTDEKALTQIIHSCESERAVVMAKTVLQVRQWAKLLGTYIDGLEARLDKNDILHPELKVHAALSGRWGSFIHTIPKPVYENKVVKVPGMRDMFIARPGFFIVESDFSQLELRNIALLSGDEKLLDAYAQGADVHSQNTIDLFGELDPNKRTLAKNFVYSVNYGPTNVEALARSTWETLRVTHPKLGLWTVLTLVRQWFKTHHWIAQWRADQLELARQRDYSEEPFSGRRRYFYKDVKDTEVYNFPIQSMGSYIMARSLRKLAPYLDWVNQALLLQWHDALIVETRDPVTTCQILRECMTQELTRQGYTLAFPIDWKVGTSLGTLTECKTLDEVREIVALPVA